jgi:hypothetical protein
MDLAERRGRMGIRLRRSRERPENRQEEVMSIRSKTWNGGRRRRGWLLLLSALALAAFLAAIASSAQASPSRFVYEMCDSQIPGGNPPSVSPTLTPDVNVVPFQTCAQPGGWFGLEQIGSMRPLSAQSVVAVPPTPGGFVESESMVGVSANLGALAAHSFVYEQGWPVEALGELRRSFYVRGEPSAFGATGDFAIVLACEGARPCPVGPQIGARYLAATEVDPTPPSLTAVSGSLLAPVVLRGHQELAVEAADVGGGVAKMEALINGVAVPAPSPPTCSTATVANPSYTGVAATSPVPCPPSFKTSWNLDTASYPFDEGTDTVQVCASDFATFGEANRTCSTPQTVTVNNSCVESSVPGGATLSARFARTKEAEVTVPFDTNAKVTGELTDQAGQPVGGATICVQSATQGSSRGPVSTGTATTDPQGSFVYAVPAGPDREVLFGYRHDSFQVADSMHYFAHVRPTIKLSAARIHSGGGVKITGRLPGGHKAAGRVVVFKAGALHSKAWYPFGETTTNGEGVFHFHYRFDDTHRTTAYKMEAAVPGQAGFPWKAGHSRPAVVEVEG